MNRAATKTTPTTTFWLMRTPTASVSAGARPKFRLRVTRPGESAMRVTVPGTAGSACPPVVGLHLHDVVHTGMLADDGGEVIRADYQG